MNQLVDEDVEINTIIFGGLFNEVDDFHGFITPDDPKLQLANFLVNTFFKISRKFA